MPVLYKYRAFLSYSRADRVTAVDLQRQLERYVLPRALRTVKLGLKLDARPLRPIFRDEDELVPGQDLPSRIRRGLQDSEVLIVICSPSAVRSEWVNQEILDFLALGPEREILSIVIAGEPHAEARGLDPGLECLPAALRFAPSLATLQTGQVVASLSSAPVEPLWIDWRSHHVRERTMFLRLVAALLALASFDELVRRDRSFRRRRTALLATVALGVITGFAVLGAVLRVQTRSALIRRSNTLASLARQAALDGNWERSARYGVLAMKSSGSWLVGYDARTAEDAMMGALLFSRRLGTPLRIASEQELGAFSADGSRIAVATPEGRVRVLDAVTGIEQKVFTIPHQIEELALSRDGSLLATQFMDNREGIYSVIEVWSALSGSHAFQTIRVSGMPLVNRMEFSPDARKLAVIEAAGDGGGAVEIFDLATGGMQDLAGYPEGIDSIAFSPDGAVFGAACKEGVQLWNAQNYKAIGKIATIGVSYASRFITLAPDDRTVAVGSGLGSLIMWDYRKRVELSNDNLPGGQVAGVAFSADGTRLGVRFDQGLVRMFAGRDPASYAVSGTKFLPAGDFAYLPDKRRMVSVADGVARWWELDRFSRHDLLPGADPDEAVDRTGAGAVARAILSSLGTGARKPVPDQEVFSPDGKVIAMLTNYGELVPLSSATLQPVGPAVHFEGDTRQALGDERLAFSPSGDLVAHQNPQGTWLVRWRTGEQWRIPTAASLEGAIAFSGDGRFLASAATENDRGEVRVWDVQTRQQVGPPFAAPAYLSHTALATHGELVAFGGDSEKVEVWDVKRRARVASAISGTGMVAFSPDGKLLWTNAAGDPADGSRLQAWDLQSGQAVGSAIKPGLGKIKRVLFLGDGTRALVLGGDVWVLWDLSANVEIGIPVETEQTFVDAHVAADLSEVTATTTLGRVDSWSLDKDLHTHGDALIRAVCGRIVPGALSRLSPEELVAAPVLDRRRDTDACGR